MSSHKEASHSTITGTTVTLPLLHLLLSLGHAVTCVRSVASEMTRGWITFTFFLSFFSLSLLLIIRFSLDAIHAHSEMSLWLTYQTLLEWQLIRWQKVIITLTTRGWLRLFEWSNLSCPLQLCPPSRSLFVEWRMQIRTVKERRVHSYRTTPSAGERERAAGREKQRQKERERETRQKEVKVRQERLCHCDCKHSLETIDFSRVTAARQSESSDAGLAFVLSFAASDASSLSM